MAGYLLDTNHLGRWIDARHPLRARILAAIRRGNAFYIILPALTETIAGFSILPRAAQNWAEWQVLRPTLTYGCCSLRHSLTSPDAVGSSRGAMRTWSAVRISGVCTSALPTRRLASIPESSCPCCG